MSEVGWLPNEFGVYDNRSDNVNGLSIGSTINYCRNNAYDWVFLWDRLSNYIFNQDRAPFFNVVTGRQNNEMTPSNGTNFIESINTGNTTAILCYVTPASSSPGYGGVTTSYLDGQTRHNLRNNSTVTVYSGTGSSLWNYRIILNSIDCEHYLMVPLITARDIQGNVIQNIEWATYNSTYAQQYPCITQIYVRYYYKPDLWQNSLSGLNLFFAVRPQRNKKYLDSPRNAGYPNYIREIYASDVVLGFSNTIFVTPTLQSAIVATSGLYTTALYGDVTTHDVFQFYVGDPINNIPPFLFIDAAMARQIINSVGIWWCDSVNSAQYEAHGKDTTSNAVHAVRITEGGATTKTDFTGEDIAKHWEDPGYLPLGGRSIIIGGTRDPQGEDPDPDDPDKPGRENPDPLPEDTPTLNLEEPAYTGVGCFSTYYSLAMADVARLNNDLWTSDDDTITALIEGLRMWGTDPMQAVMSLRLYPFDINQYVSHSEKQHIVFGRVEMPIAAGWVLENNASAVLNLGWMSIKSRFNDFRDYYPYTQIKLYVPFIGMIDLNSSEIMNKKVEIQMIVDLTTGSCEVCILANGKPLVYQSGNMGVEIPITLNTMAGTSQAIMQGIFEMATSGAMGTLEQTIQYISPESAMTSALTGETNSIKFMGNQSIGNIGNIAAQITLGASTSSQTGKSSPACNMANPLIPYFVITTPSWEIPQNYNHTYGKVCHKSGLASSFSGFTVCKNVDTTGVTCTELEQNMIKSLLESGVYL